MQLTKEQKKAELKRILADDTKRIAYLERDLYMFGMYYFRDAFSCPSANFHKEWCKQFMNNKHLLLIAFRESAKSFWLMVKFIHNIVYRKKRNMFYICYDKVTANERLFDIANALQTNPRLLKDFGNLFPSAQRQGNGPTKRAITQFITTNGIRCKALSLRGKVRGSVFLTNDGMFRPDFLGLDDIDVDDSVRSIDMIDNNYRRLLGEVFGSLADNVQIICIGNVIRDDGIVLRLEEDMKHNEKWFVQRVAIYDEKGDITWKARFTDSGEEGKIDLLQKRKDQGEIAYNQNFLLIGFSGENAIIKLNYIHYEVPPARDQFDRVVIGVDPAYSEKKLSDFFAITVTGHVGEKKYILECIKLAGLMKDLPKSVPIVKSLYIKHRASMVAVETQTERFVLKAIQEQKMYAIGISPRQRGDKITRLAEYQAQFEQGKIVFNPNGMGINDLVKNLLKFPNVAHDDDVDSMVYSFERHRKKALAK